MQRYRFLGPSDLELIRIHRVDRKRDQMFDSLVVYAPGALRGLGTVVPVSSETNMVAGEKPPVVFDIGRYASENALSIQV